MKNTKHIVGIAIIIALFSAVFISSGANPVFALGNSTNSSMNITVGTNLTMSNLTIPKVFVGRQELFTPSNQTYNTSIYFGANITNGHGDSGILLPMRQNYFFTGEKITYYVVVMDGEGSSTINETHIYLKNTTDIIDAGVCANVTDFSYTGDFTFFDYNDNLMPAYDPLYMRSFVCNITVQDWIGEKWVYAGAIDAAGNAANSSMIEYIYFNPSISIVVDGTINFGSVAQGTTSISNTVYIKNVDLGYNINGSGIVVDMYISSDDLFTDPFNPLSTCGNYSGFHHSFLSYYATKGSFNSGYNTNLYSGMGLSTNTSCVADNSGFTPMPATNSSNELSNMCRIINWDIDGSLLSQGSEMSLTFKADIPNPCSGTFINGQFYFIGEVI